MTVFKFSDEYSTSTPYQPVDYSKSFLFGLIRISIRIVNQDYSETPVDQDRKYKHMINVNVFGYEFSAIIRSGTVGLVIVNGDGLT